MPPRVNVTYGLNVTLYCKVMGSPKPKIEWLRGVRPDFRPLPFNGKYTLGRDNSLIIRDVKLGDKGFYTCMAKNSINADSKSVEVIVTGMSKDFRVLIESFHLPPSFLFRFLPLYSLPFPVLFLFVPVSFRFFSFFFSFLCLFSSVPPSLLHLLLSEPPVLAYLKAEQTALEGDRKRIKCTVTESKPEATIIWMRNGEEMKSNGRVLVSDGLLMFNEVKVMWPCISFSSIQQRVWDVANVWGFNLLLINFFDF